MEILREFLESSTIHGLVYISSSKSNVTKFLWACVVIAGFTIAGVLINSSYSDWRDNPVSTTISTHPISELKFPKITVCPPSGTNTALNYDLMKLNNTAMDDDTKERLKEALKQENSVEIYEKKNKQDIAF